MAAAGAPLEKHISTNVFYLAAQIQSELVQLRNILWKLQDQPAESATAGIESFVFALSTKVAVAEYFQGVQEDLDQISNVFSRSKYAMVALDVTLYEDLHTDFPVHRARVSDLIKLLNAYEEGIDSVNTVYKQIAKDKKAAWLTTLQPLAPPAMG